MARAYHVEIDKLGDAWPLCPVTMTFEAICAEQVAALQTRSVELSCVSLGGSVRAFSDEWFADAANLIKPGPAVSLKGQFGPKGALYDGWETRRHNPDYDWVIIRLAPAGGGKISGFDIDTTTFNGNEAPAFEIYGLWSEQPDVEENSDQVRCVVLMAVGDAHGNDVLWPGGTSLVPAHGRWFDRVELHTCETAHDP